MENSVKHEFETYRCGKLLRFPLTGESDIVYVPSLGRAYTLTRRDSERIATCSEFLPIEEHADRIVQQLSSCADPGEIRKRLRELCEAGLMITHSEFLRMCSSSSPAEGAAERRLEWLAVPTRSRPSCVLNAIRSYDANIRAHGRSVRVMVSDQTPIDGASDLASALRSLSKKSDTEIFYAGLKEKTAFSEALAHDGSIPPDVIRFALFGDPLAPANIGANRNAILLHTFGSMVVSVDDDTLCELSRAPGTGRSVRICGERDPTEAWFFNDRAQMRAFLRTCNLDFVAGHDEMLGRGIGNILLEADSRNNADVTAACVHMLDHLCSGRGRVLATYTGLAGDAGMHSAFGFMVHPSPETKDRLTVSAEVYAQNIESREVVRQALHSTITHGLGAAGLATCMGLDNRDGLPPFFPPFRSEDGIFAHTVTRGFEGSCFGHVPFAVIHDRPQRRGYGDIVPVRMSDLVLSALAACPISIADTSPSDRLKRFGHTLSYLGGLSKTDFREWAQGAVLARASTIGQVAQATLRHYCCYPDYWAKDVSQITERISKAISDPEYIVPEEVSECGGLPAAAEILRQFGNLLYWWPAIIEQTKQLAKGGKTIGRRVS